jgi:hypothetical protein
MRDESELCQPSSFRPHPCCTAPPRLLNRLAFCMVRNNLLKLVALLLCFCAPNLLSVAGQSSPLDNQTLDLFVGYPEIEDFRVVVHSHARRERMDKAQVAFYSTWFLNGNPHVPMGTIVYEDGSVRTYARSRWKQPANVDLQLLSATVRQLPGTASGVALANLMIVSFRHDGKWQTRLYDRTKLPPELLEIHKLVHSPLEAR